MTAKQLAHKYLQEARVIQLATSADDKPWACNVHFYADDDFNIYWFSSQQRLHSLQIAANPHAAAVLMVKQDSPTDSTVIGVSLAGPVELIENLDKSIAQAFIKKQGKSEDYLDNILDGSSDHKCYKLSPTQIVLFDNKHFPDNPRQEVTVGLS